MGPCLLNYFLLVMGSCLLNFFSWPKVAPLNVILVTRQLVIARTENTHRDDASYWRVIEWLGHSQGIGYGKSRVRVNRTTVSETVSNSISVAWVRFIWVAQRPRGESQHSQNLICVGAMVGRGCRSSVEVVSLIIIIRTNDTQLAWNATNALAFRGNKRKLCNARGYL